MLEGTGRTIWRGVGVAHPADWEVALVSGPSVAGRLSLVDRRYQRMDLSWRTLGSNIDLDLILAQHRQHRRKEDQNVENLSGLPSPWKGVMVHDEGIDRFHAVRQYKDTHLLVEATVLWPKGLTRDRSLERELLEGIWQDKPTGQKRHWKALGLEVRLGKDWDLADCNAVAGKVCWTFQQDIKHTPKLTICRIAMPEVLGEKKLTDWIKEQLPPSSKVLDSGETFFNRHEAGQTLSRHVPGLLPAVITRPIVRRDIVFICPSADRLYHLAMSVPTRQGSADLPDSLTLECCSSQLATQGVG